MNINNYFNPKRFFLTLKNEIIRNSKMYLTTLGAIAGIITAIDMLPGIITGSTINPTYMYLPILIPLGFIFSSIVFNEMHDPQKGLIFLTTPSSSLEKLISKLLITALLYVVVMFLFFHLLTWMLNGINIMFFGTDAVSFSFSWEYARIYMIVQSIFIFASSYFKKNAFLKLLFAGFLLQIFFLFFSIINFRLFFNISDFTHINFEDLDLSISDISDLATNTYYAAKFLFNWVMAPFFWFMTYLRITEKEV